jgi:suppressor for copper-sensitivity B
MFCRTVFILGLALGLPVGGVFAPAPALSAATEWVDSDFSQIRLIAGWGDQKDLRAGLQIRLEEGWKTYWRSPGDSGIPTQIDWSGSKNTRSLILRHPIPHRIDAYGYQSLVYENQVVLPVRFEKSQAGKSVQIKAIVDYAVCRNICVPLHAELSLELDDSLEPGASDQAHGRLIDRYAARVPSTGPHDDLSVQSVTLEGEAGAERLRVVIAARQPMSAPGLIVEAPPPFGFGLPGFVVEGNRTTASISINGGKSKKSLGGQHVILTVYDGTTGIERAVVINKAP